MNAVLLKSLPVADPERLVYLRISDPPRGTGTVNTNETILPVYDSLRKQTNELSSLIAYVPLSTAKLRCAMARSRKKPKATWSAAHSSPASA